MPDVQLVVGGATFAGWKKINVRRSMTHCTGDFDLGVTWRAPVFLGERRIGAGEACQLLIGSETVISGYVDGVDQEWSDREQELHVQGRDKAADLVDCSAIARTGQWTGQRIEQIVADLARPFGVAVRARVDTGAALPSFAIQEGESAFDAADRAARVRGLLLVSEGDGTLAITRAGVDRVPSQLELGVNVLELRAVVDTRDRYSHYIAKGQAPGSDYFNGAAVAQMKAEAADPGVTRYRPLVITADQPDLAATLQQRVRWEANVRAAQSMDVRARVQGWTRVDGGLWRPNMLVRVKAAPLELDADLLITDVEYVLGEAGTVTRLRMTRADAFTLLPLRATPAAAGRGDPGKYFETPKGK